MAQKLTDMRPPKDIPTVVNGGWAIVKFCLAQYEQGVALTEEEHNDLRDVHLECCRRLVQVEDGPAVLVTEHWMRRSLRYVEESASNLLAALAEAKTHEQRQAGKTTNDR